MGSPYQLNVSKIVHVIRTKSGFVKQLRLVLKSMDTFWDDRTIDLLDLESIDDSNFNFNGPESSVVYELIKAYRECVTLKSRLSITLSPSYDWRGSQNFSRVIILDFTVRKC